ncbi:hypothetical protein FE904_16350 [Chryseobacterium indologenes]|uniref:hypothetical protein n=1 Tax=Chryseobacterium indologenes TaxID=253 RepID=UPI001108122F|nr:hypothetical protein [Chryseobacterium indologenes]TLX24422.1 hypothetical protein FE904_16350 [Chryseobacterium indologenes]
MPGVEFDKKKETQRKGIEPTKVKSIKLLTPLDNGSANEEASPIKTQPGFLFGKTYRFQVVTYTNLPPQDKKKIRWKYKYYSPSKNKWIEHLSTITGEIYSLHLNEKDMCGSYIYVMAYINDEASEGRLKIWHHNRFRWFNEAMFEAELKVRTDDKHPERINQSGTSLCGMACVFYLFAKEQPAAYKKFAKELFRTGESTYKSYTAKPSIDILEKKINTKGFPLNSSDMPLVDYVTMASTRNTDNPKYKGGDEEFQAINWPNVVINLCEKLLGYSDVHSKGVYNPIKPLATSTMEMQIKIDDINKQLSNGYRLMLMIDSDLIQDIWDKKSFDLHWVVLETPITWDYEPGFFKSKKDEVMFKVYSWGTKDTYLEAPISWQHFMMNYNGYIKMK